MDSISRVIAQVDPQRVLLRRAVHYWFVATALTCAGAIAASLLH